MTKIDWEKVDVIDDKLVIRYIPVPESSGGLVIPEVVRSKKRMLFAEVLASASRGIPRGSFVVVDRIMGDVVDTDVRIVSRDQIAAIVQHDEDKREEVERAVRAYDVSKLIG